MQKYDYMKPLTLPPKSDNLEVSVDNAIKINGQWWTKLAVWFYFYLLYVNVSNKITISLFTLALNLL